MGRGPRNGDSSVSLVVFVSLSTRDCLSSVLKVLISSIRVNINE